MLALEEDVGEYGEDDEGDDFLDYLELHEGEGTSIAFEADTVGWDLKGVLEEGYRPREGDDADKRP